MTLDSAPSKPPRHNDFRPAWAMIAILLAIALIAGLSDVFRSDEIIPWRTDYSAAVKESHVRHAPQLLYFTADWCGPCQEMKHTVWASTDVNNSLKNYIPVKIDYDSHPDLDHRFGVQAMPTLILVDPQGQVLRRSVGELSTAQFLQWIRHGSTLD